MDSRLYWRVYPSTDPDLRRALPDYLPEHDIGITLAYAAVLVRRLYFTCPPPIKLLGLWRMTFTAAMDDGYITLYPAMRATLAHGGDPSVLLSSLPPGAPFNPADIEWSFYDKGPLPKRAPGHPKAY